MPELRGRKSRRWPAVVGRALLWGFVGLCVVILLALVVIPRVIGATPYTVISGSMEPGIPTGSVVVAEPQPFEEVGVGDVVTYQLEPGQAEVVTHRVVGIDTVDGEPRLRTQGDANEEADPEPVRSEQLRGTVRYHVPYIGHVSTAVSGPVREQLSVVAGGALILYAAWLVFTEIRSRRARAGQEQAARDVDRQHTDI